MMAEFWRGKYGAGGVDSEHLVGNTDWQTATVRFIAPSSSYSVVISLWTFGGPGQAYFDDVKIKELAKKTEGYTGADIEVLCRKAGMIALHEDMNIPKVSYRHFKAALKKINPSTTPKTREYYEQIARELGMEPDEVLRLKQISGLSEVFADEEYSEAWTVE